MIELVGNEGAGACIKVMGMGGGGGNAVNTMIASGLRGVEFIVANTDAQALTNNLAPVKLQLGAKGLGAGARPEVGRAAAEEHGDRIREQLAGADMVFVTAGMGGGTGTGGAPVVGRIARELGALSVGVVTKPFGFEGKRRMQQAEQGITELQDAVDTLIVIPNQRLLATVARQTSVLDAFRGADDILLQAVRGISDLVTVHGLINLDFADVRTIMSEMGMAIMGSGTARGDARAIEAAQRAISSPLLEDLSIRGARGVLINITGSADLALHEIDAAASLIQEEAHADANIIFGAVIDESMGDELRITVIATGFGPGTAAVAPVEIPAQVAQAAGSRVVGGYVSKNSSVEAIRRLGAADRPVVRIGTIIDAEGEPQLRPHHGAAPAPGRDQSESAQSEFTIDPIHDEDTEHDFESPAFLRRAK